MRRQTRTLTPPFRHLRQAKCSWSPNTPMRCSSTKRRRAKTTIYSTSLWASKRTSKQWSTCTVSSFPCSFRWRVTLLSWPPIHPCWLRSTDYSLGWRRRLERSLGWSICNEWTKNLWRTTSSSPLMRHKGTNASNATSTLFWTVKRWHPPRLTKTLHTRRSTTGSSWRTSWRTRWGFTTSGWT